MFMAVRKQRPNSKTILQDMKQNVHVSLYTSSWIYVIQLVIIQITYQPVCAFYFCYILMLCSELLGN